MFMSLRNIWNVLRIRLLLTLRKKSTVIALDISDLKLSPLNPSPEAIFDHFISVRKKTQKHCHNKNLNHDHLFIPQRQDFFDRQSDKTLLLMQILDLSSAASVA